MKLDRAVAKAARSFLFVPSDGLFKGSSKPRPRDGASLTR